MISYDSARFEKRPERANNSVSRPSVHHLVSVGSKNDQAPGSGVPTSGEMATLITRGRGRISLFKNDHKQRKILQKGLEMTENDRKCENKRHCVIH